MCKEEANQQHRKDQRREQLKTLIERGVPPMPEQGAPKKYWYEEAEVLFAAWDAVLPLRAEDFSAQHLTHAAHLEALDEAMTIYFALEEILDQRDAEQARNDMAAAAALGVKVGTQTLH